MAKWFSVLDLKSEYYQIAMHTEYREKTAFICPLGFFAFNQMPRGYQGFLSHSKVWWSMRWETWTWSRFWCTLMTSLLLGGPWKNIKQGFKRFSKGFMKDWNYNRRNVISNFVRLPGTCRFSRRNCHWFQEVGGSYYMPPTENCHEAEIFLRVLLLSKICSEFCKDCSPTQRVTSKWWRQKRAWEL